ncbi:MFS transporter [Ochrobactrum sp. POC9]|uniref:MFS transporter n=1 Tax=unclassified Ochrobactrum TaxID=239106 RepID=UPI000D705EFD|nr:MFS transporter [Ochrobactrum sp. POC9]MCH4540822.1 MFS transporter [Ochrobactrum sp. A-1]PWU71825.1 MFS transporter [Ochrobactrum sp. POC9]
MSDQVLTARGYASRRGVWGWIFFDWAAQPFFTVVVTFIFGPYFISRMAATAHDGQIAWGYGVAAASFVIAILSPVLGSIADQTGARKPWIGFFAVLKIVSLLTLWFAVPGANMFWVLLAFSIAMISAEFSIVFNDSMMPRLVPREHIGRVSNLAWGLGYLGGMIVLFFVVLCLSASPETGKTVIGMTPLFGLDPVQGEDARITGPLSAIWYLVFILPMFLFTPDQARGKPLRQAIGSGLSELRSTLSEVRKHPGIARFLVARMIYQDGVNSMTVMGAGYAASLFHWSITEIGLYGMFTIVIAIFSCLIASWMDSRFGSKVVVMISVALLLLASIGFVSTGSHSLLFGLVAVENTPSDKLFAMPGERAFLIYGIMLGLAFGPVQASSRSWFARSINPADAGRYFGIYALSGRATSFMGPFLVASVTALTSSSAMGMSVLILFFLAGLILTAKTPYPANR